MGYRDSTRRRDPRKLDAIILALRKLPIAPWVRIFGSAANASKIFPGDIDIFVDLNDPTLDGGSHKAQALKTLALAGGWRGNHGYLDPYVLDRQGELHTRSSGISTGWETIAQPEPILRAVQTGIALSDFTRNFVAEQTAANVPEPTIPTSNDYSLQASSWDIVLLTRALHRRSEDLDEGDLIERIETFTTYTLVLLPLSIVDFEEFATRDDLVDDYAERTDPMPPIVFDATCNSIIDGSHRAAAADRRGQTQILAYVGK